MEGSGTAGKGAYFRMSPLTVSSEMNRVVPANVTPSWSLPGRSHSISSVPSASIARSLSALSKLA